MSGSAWVVAERAEEYDAGRVGAAAGGVAAGAGADGAGAGGLAAAVAALDRAVAAVAAVDVEEEDAGAVLEASVALQRLADRVTAQQLRVLDVAERREAYGRDGAVTMAAWLRGRTRLDHGQAQRKVQAARRLGRLSELRAAFASGAVTFDHVAAVTSAAVPRRMEAIAACEGTLVELARRGSPRDVRRAVQAVRDHVDPDGSDSPPLDERGLDERRYLDIVPTIDGLVAVRGLVDQVQGEALATVVDAFATLEPADTPEPQRRSAGQRRADALADALTRLLDAGETPLVGGNRPHIVCTVDLATLVGLDEEAARPPRLRHTGELDPRRARALALERAKVQAVLTLGPWRVVNVGRTQRTLPAWLRLALELVHRHCRGPDCERPISWTEAHHVIAWAAERGETDLNATVPLCVAHHQLVTTGGWRMTFDPDDGACTWTSPDGLVVEVPPPTP